MRSACTWVVVVVGRGVDIGGGEGDVKGLGDGQGMGEANI